MAYGACVFLKFKNISSAACLCSLVTTLGGACTKKHNYETHKPDLARLAQFYLQDNF